MNSRDHTERFSIMVQRLTSRYVALWNETPEEMPEFHMRFSPRQQLENERKLESQLRELPSSLTTYEGMDEVKRIQVHSRVKKTIIGLPFFAQDAFNDEFFEASEVVTGSFIRAAREYDPSITESDILQALRNMWVFNSIQVIFEQPVSLTPSSLAYSLLYPFTDNGLDSDSRTEDEKAALLRWLNRWFEGDGRETVDNWTLKVAGLLHMIEEEYPRSEFPDVHHSLLAIHSAQRKSLLLRDNLPDVGETSLLPITVEKGGTSVLVDGYLVSPKLDAPGADLLFGYGVLLQFVDDLQDLEEDKCAGFSTPFLRALGSGRLDEITYRLIHFTRHWGAMLKQQVPSRIASIQRVIEGSCTFLIAEAVARYRELYGMSFVRILERSVPFHLEYLAELQQNLRKQRAQLSEYSDVENDLSAL